VKVFKLIIVKEHVPAFRAAHDAVSSGRVVEPGEDALLVSEVSAVWTAHDFVGIVLVSEVDIANWTGLVVVGITLLYFKVQAVSTDSASHQILELLSLYDRIVEVLIEAVGENLGEQIIQMLAGNCQASAPDSPIHATASGFKIRVDDDIYFGRIADPKNCECIYVILKLGFSESVSFLVLFH